MGHCTTLHVLVYSRVHSLTGDTAAQQVYLSQYQPHVSGAQGLHHIVQCT